MLSCIVSLCHQARLPRQQLVELGSTIPSVARGTVSSRRMTICAFLDQLALLDEDLADDASGGVLNFFDVRNDNEEPGRDHGACELRRWSPAAKPPTSTRVTETPSRFSLRILRRSSSVSG